MFHLVYVSSAVKPFSQSQLVELLVKARKNNSQRGITGMLLYKDGNFMQVLEGEETAVRELYDIIHQDPRHTGTIVLLEEELSKPQFGDWSMGFRNLADPTVQSLPGFSQFMNQPLRADSFRHDPSGCLELLNLFRQSM
jgi:hypothetical protein